MRDHHIPANAAEFAALCQAAALKNFSPLNTFGFALRDDAHIKGWPHAAWRIRSNEEFGTFHVWSDTDFVSFRIERGHADCNSVLARVFGLGSEDMPALMPDASPNQNVFLYYHDATWARRVQTARDKIVPNAHDFEDNFRLGRSKVFPVLSEQALDAAWADSDRSGRIKNRQQALDLFPAFDLCEPHIVEIIDAGEPLTSFLKTKYGVFPSTIKALREHRGMKRVSPDIFRGVYGPDLSGAPMTTPALNMALSFCDQRGVPMRLLAPLLPRVSKAVLHPFFRVMEAAIHDLDIPVKRMVKILDDHGGAKLMMRTCETIRAGREEMRRGRVRIHDLCEKVPDLPDFVVPMTYIGVQNGSLRLVRKGETVLDMVQGWKTTFWNMNGEVRMPGAAIWDEMVFDVLVNDVNSGRYILVGKQGRVTGWAEQKFRKLETGFLTGFSEVDVFAHALNAHLKRDEEVMNLFKRMAESRRFEQWTQKMRTISDSHNALRRRARLPTTSDVFGFPTRAEMIQATSVTVSSEPLLRW